jgi:hypothetical protein
MIWFPSCRYRQYPNKTALGSVNLDGEKLCEAKTQRITKPSTRLPEMSQKGDRTQRRCDLFNDQGPDYLCIMMSGISRRTIAGSTWGLRTSVEDVKTWAHPRWRMSWGARRKERTVSAASMKKHFGFYITSCIPSHASSATKTGILDCGRTVMLVKKQKQLVDDEASNHEDS